jgi:uncharacterized membrane protein YbhN (UPF0104 family)
MKNNLYRFLKCGWIFIVVVFIGVYFEKNYPDILEAASHLKSISIILSFIFILVAKILIVLFMRNVILGVGKVLSLWKCYKIYNISQLGKYIPGNIWHFVGKAAAFKAEGFSAGQIKDALIIENCWLVLSALFYGIVLMLIFDHKMMGYLFSSYKIIFLMLLIFLLIIIVFTRIFYKKTVFIFFKNRVLNTKIAIVQLFIWSALGLAFGILAVSFFPQDAEASIFMIMGLYAIAYSIGFITPFAPAGLGIRETILSIGLLPYISLEVILLISAANRLLYIIVEILLALSTQLYRPSKKN